MKDGRILKSTLRTKDGEFEAAKYHGKNPSGIHPVNDKVLVLVDQATEKTSGGIIIPTDKREQQSVAASRGVIIAVGPSAFRWNSDRTAEWSGDRPQAGDRVFFQRYAGELYQGDDGLEYRVMSDMSIGAIGSKPDAKKAA